MAAPAANASVSAKNMGAILSSMHSGDNQPTPGLGPSEIGLESSFLGPIKSLGGIDFMTSMTGGAADVFGNSIKGLAADDCSVVKMVSTVLDAKLGTPVFFDSFNIAFNREGGGDDGAGEGAEPQQEQEPYEDHGMDQDHAGREQEQHPNDDYSGSDNGGGGGGEDPVQKTSNDQSTPTPDDGSQFFGQSESFYSPDPTPAQNGYLDSKANERSI